MSSSSTQSTTGDDKSADMYESSPHSSPPPYTIYASNGTTHLFDRSREHRSVIVNFGRKLATSTVTVIPVDDPSGCTPLYSVIIDMDRKPNVTLYSGAPVDNIVLGEASFTHKSSTMIMYLRGQETKLNMNGVTGNFKLDSPMGECKWFSSLISAAPTRIEDALGTVLATTTSVSRSRGTRRLDAQVSTDSNLLEFLVFSMVVCHAYNVMIVSASNGRVGTAC